MTDGRPEREPGTKNTKVEFRATSAQRARWKESSQRTGRTLSAWICLACDYAAHEARPARPTRVTKVAPAVLVRIQVRATGNQLQSWRVAAKAARRSRSNWMCHACDRFLRVPGAATLIPRPRRPARRGRVPS